MVRGHGSNQHLRNAVLRAVENRVPLVRAANTGISCVVAPSGRVGPRLAEADGRTWMPGVLWADVAAPPGRDGLDLLQPIWRYVRHCLRRGRGLVAGAGAVWNRRNGRESCSRKNRNTGPGTGRFFRQDEQDLREQTTAAEDGFMLTSDLCWGTIT